MKQDDLVHLKGLGIDLDPTLLYSATPDKMVKYTRQKILGIISEIEKSAKEYKKLTEDGISSIIATALGQTMGLTVVREANSRGHVDLTITAPTYIAPHKFQYLGEAKVWSTKQYCIDGFEQLMGYVTGRHQSSFTIIYFRIKECDEQFKEYIEELLQQKGGSRLTLEARYVLTSHTHTSSAKLETDHYAAHLPK